MKITKIFFHFINLVFLTLYLYPGSIFGYLLYGNLNKQPKISPDFYFSSNHVYAFVVLSLFGLICHINKKKNYYLLCNYINFFRTCSLNYTKQVIPIRRLIW